MDRFSQRKKWDYEEGTEGCNTSGCEDKGRPWDKEYGWAGEAGKGKLCSNQQWIYFEFCIGVQSKNTFRKMILLQKEILYSLAYTVEKGYQEILLFMIITNNWNIYSIKHILRMLRDSNNLDI